MSALESKSFACDIGTFISHGAVRTFVMGERCNISDKPGGMYTNPVSDDEIAEMKIVVKEAVEAGALGFSTNRLAGHRDGRGTCVPGTFGSAFEYTELCKGMAEAGGGVAQFVSDYASYDDVRNPWETDNKKARAWQKQTWQMLEPSSCRLTCGPHRHCRLGDLTF